ELWGEVAPANVEATLRTLLSRVRRALSERGFSSILVRERAAGYRLEVTPDIVDALRFERLARRGQGAFDVGSGEQAAVDLEAGLRLWRGAPLGEFTEYAFARTAAIRLDELRLQATEDLVEAQLSLGQTADALLRIQGQVDGHPYRERAWGLLMTILYRLGRQAEALQAFAQLRAILAGDLGIDPSPALCHLERQVLLQSPELEGLSTHWGGIAAKSQLADGDPPETRSSLRIEPVGTQEPDSEGSAHPLRPPEAIRHRLPGGLGRIFGRERELAKVIALVQTSRLVTLTGVGGVGKTRLALEVAAQVLDGFPEGVFFSELALLADPDFIADHLLGSIGARGATQATMVELADEGLCRHLESRAPLLVIDNCEHLIDAVAGIVERLLRRCPRISILTTSRESLGINGEVTWSVPPLSLPSEGARELGELSDSDAVGLFCERSRAADPSFSLTADNAAAVAHICRRLDGIPLALELAAARLRVLSLDQISEHLDQRLWLLAGGTRSAADRHRTLRAAMDWSHQLLTGAERLAMRRLSAFPATFSLDIAVAVVRDEEFLPQADVLGVLGGLVDKSLLGAESVGREKRFRMLETVREYARERLAEAGETELVQRRHGDLLLDLVRRYWVADPRAGTGRWLRRFDVEHDNLRAALEWFLTTGEVDACLEIAGALRVYWLFAGRLSEACHWYERSLARSTETRTPARVAALNGFGLLV
ncbi:MAG: AfsR/SARP family transcriptional regulator, partial [Acidimicrobiia bacterium]